MTSPLRMVMVSDVSPLRIEGGGERVLWEQASRLAARGHAVRVLSRTTLGASTDSLDRQGVLIRHFPVSQGSSLRFLLSSILAARCALTGALAHSPADVLQLYQPFAGYGALRSPRAKGLPVLYTFLSPAPLEYISRAGMTRHHRPGVAGRVAQAMIWGIERACLRKVDRIHVLSDFSAFQLWQLYGIPTSRIVRIPGGVDAERFRPAADRLAARNALELPPDRPLLLTIRNLEARMGLDTLIHALNCLRQSLPEALLLVGGAGSLRESLQALVESLQLQNHVRFLGYIPEATLPLHYQAADLFVLPTRELEGFGLITVEALACGTPVLGTTVGATPEILAPLDPVLLMPEATPEAMAESIRRFFAAHPRNTPAAQACRQACRRHVERQYTWERSVDVLEGTLADLASRSPAGAAPSCCCPACGGQRWEADLAYQGKPFLCCPACRVGVVATLPTQASLRQFYNREYPLQYRHERVADRRATMFASLLDRLRPPGPLGRLLDVGCGGGHLLAAAAERGWSGLGTDLSYQACGVTRSSGLTALQADCAELPFRDGCVEAVSLINVLDHGLDPLRTVHEAYRVLRPGGRLVIRIPNASFHRPWVKLLTSLGPPVRRLGWDGYPILHLFAFTPTSLRRLVTRVGFRVVAMQNSPLAAEGVRSTDGWLGALAPPALRAVISGIGGGLRVLSGGRWLVGPSIELHAERPSPPSNVA
ncbi:MAG: glycosyltransferase [candidate division NC10 bacterium]|nr:glycosyltransferase [candidate division NC10 bacterium]